MTLGTGIFLSTVLTLVSLALWWVTRNHLWKSAGKAVGAIVAVTVLAAVSYWTWLKYQHRPKPETSYLGISLGDSADQVLYAKGSPDWVGLIYTDEKGATWMYRHNYDPTLFLPDEIRSFPVWGYGSQGGGRAYAKFSYNKDQVISVICEDSMALCPELLGVSIGDTEERVVARLGKPSNEELRRPDAGWQYKTVHKTIAYNELGARFVLTERKVDSIELLSDVDEGKPEWSSLAARCQRQETKEECSRLLKSELPETSVPRQ